MKTVSLVVTAMMLFIGAAAQTIRSAAPKRTVAHLQQKTKKHKVKLSATTASAGKNGEVVTLWDETAYKAKAGFEEMLMRRLEIDAERERQSQKD
jgi:uncharacterized protein YxeA